MRSEYPTRLEHLAWFSGLALALIGAGTAVGWIIRGAYYLARMCAP